MIIKTAFQLCLVLACSTTSFSQTNATNANQPRESDSSSSIVKLDGSQFTNKNRWLRYSVLSPHRKGTSSATGIFNFSSVIDSAQGTTRIFMRNLTLEQMLTHGLFKSNRVILNVKDASKFRYHSSYGPKERWNLENTFCYDLLLPSGVYSGIQTLDNELSNILNVKCERIKRNVEALVLSRTSKVDKLKSKGIGESFADSTGKLNNVPLSSLTFLIIGEDMPPVLDETHYDHYVDLNLEIRSWTDLKYLQQALKKYDLQLKLEKRELLMFVISENKI